MKSILALPGSGLGKGVGVGIGVGVTVGFFVGVGVGVLVFVGVSVFVAEGFVVGVAVGFLVGVLVGLGVGVLVKVGVVAPCTVTVVGVRFLVTSPELPIAAVCVPESNFISVGPPEATFALKLIVATVSVPCLGSLGKLPNIIEAVPGPT